MFVFMLALITATALVNLIVAFNNKDMEHLLLVVFFTPILALMQFGIEYHSICTTFWYGLECVGLVIIAACVADDLLGL